MTTIKLLDSSDSTARNRWKINDNSRRFGVGQLKTGIYAQNHNRNIGVSYNKTTRKVTLTDDDVNDEFKGYYDGYLIAELVDGWISPAHVDPLVAEPTLTGSKTYFLKYDGEQFLFDEDIWTFDQMMIASVQLKYVAGTLTQVLCLREPHGTEMSGETHKHLHNELGTGRVKNGALFSGVVLNSTTAADRRPFISGVRLADEDLETDVQNLATNSYCQRFLTGTATRNLLASQTDIVKLSGNQPYFNQWTGSAWTDTPFPNNDYGALFIVAVPASKDSDSQLYRYMFVQPQQTSGDLTVIQALSPSDLVHGEATSLVAEYNFIGKIIIRYTASNWSITSIEELIGTKIQQSSGMVGYGLATATTDGLMSSTNFNKLAGIEALADVTDGVNVGSAMWGATAKTTPLDADTVPISDTAASNVIKKVTWTNIKAFLKTYFDTLYPTKAVATTTTDGLMDNTDKVILDALNTLVTAISSTVAVGTADKGTYTGHLLLNQILELNLSNGNTAASPTITIGAVAYTISGMPTTAPLVTTSQTYRLSKTAATVLTFIAYPDYPCEQGVSGVWTYERYASGKCIVHGSPTVAITSSGTFGTGGLYMHNGTFTMTTGMFNATPKALASTHPAVSSVYATPSAYTTSATAGGIGIIKTNSTGANITDPVYLIGTWK